MITVPCGYASSVGERRNRSVPVEPRADSTPGMTSVAGLKDLRQADDQTGRVSAGNVKRCRIWETGPSGYGLTDIIARRVPRAAAIV